MRLNRWIRPWLVAVALVGCESNPAQAQTGAAATAPSKANAPASLSGPALSYFRAVGANQCEWVRQPLPSGEPTAISFEAACAQSMPSWNRAGTEGLVFSVPVGEGTRPRLWRVDFAAKAAKRIDLTGLPRDPGEQGLRAPIVEEVGFDGQGHVVAIVADMYQDRKPEKDAQGQFLLFEGKRYPVPAASTEDEEGWPGLALAYRLEAGGWKRIEIKGTLYHAVDAPEWGILDASQSLLRPGFPSSDISSEERAPSSVAKKLDAAVKKVARGHWMYLPTPDGLLYYRATREGEDDFYPTPPVRWDKGGKLVELAGFSAEPADRLYFQIQNGLLLIVVSGQTRSAHVFEAGSKKKLLSVKNVDSPILWPLPANP